MSKIIVIKITKAGTKVKTFSISDDLGNVLISNVSKKDLIAGITLTVENSVKVVIITSTNKECPTQTINVPVSAISIYDLAKLEFVESNTGSVWSHLKNPQIYNTYYGTTHPYIIEYPFAYQYNDEILQAVEDYSSVYEYLPSIYGVFDDARKIETNDKYFNKAVLYNNQQSSGILELVTKPVNNLKAYNSYPKFNTESKTITFVRTNSFYKYNTFWSVVKDLRVPLFISSCESLSLDKEVNQTNMDYSTRSFKKEPLRAKDLKIRHILDNSCTTHIVSKFIVTPSQISYK